MTDSPQNSAPLLSYASSTPLAALGDLFRDGPLLVVRHHTTLPPRCILCNHPASPTQKPLTLKFTWDPSFKVTHTPSTLELRRAASIRAFLCPLHDHTWRQGRLIGLFGMIAAGLLMLASTLIAIFSEASDIPRYSPHALIALLIAFALFITFLFIYTLKTRTLTCSRIHEDYLYLEGAHESFLAALPPLPAKQNP